MEPYEYAIEVVRGAGDLLLKLRMQAFAVESKEEDPQNIVTSVDRAVNEYIVEKLREAFPEDAIYSEEGGGVVNEALRQWTIDPIDGSANFSRGIPHFAVCVGLLEGGIPILGAVYNPVTRELFSFKKGAGAFINGVPAHVSSVSVLAQAHIFFHAGRKPELHVWGGESYRRLLGAAHKTTNFASAALDACFVGAGRIEGNVYGTLSTLDNASAIGFLLEAGGVVSDEAGNPVIFSAAPQKIFMANNQSMLNELRTLLKD